MNNPMKWRAIVPASVIGLVFIIGMNRHKSANSINPKYLKWDPDHGFVFPIPEKQARFMGLPMFLAISAGLRGPTNEDLNRSTKALSALPQCVLLAEQRLIEYNAPDGIASEHLQNPHVWIDSEEPDKTKWAIVVEIKDNDGFAWHMEFKGTEFDQIWAGS